jgi:hypothetical protein
LALIVQSLATLICGFVVAMVANWQLALVIIVVMHPIGGDSRLCIAQVKFFDDLTLMLRLDE